jgi:hypothetical protein
MNCTVKNNPPVQEGTVHINTALFNAQIRDAQTQAAPSLSADYPHMGLCRGKRRDDDAKKRDKERSIKCSQVEKVDSHLGLFTSAIFT